MDLEYIEHMTVEDIQKGYRNKSFTVKEVIREYLNRILKLDDKIGAFITVCVDAALEAAEGMDNKLQRGEDLGSLGGIPVAVKDNICTRGIRTTCASKMLEDFVPPYDATVIEKLRDAGAIIIGKTNMDEFGMGSSTETSAMKITCNPWDVSRVPGGSSGGSAASVAAGFVPLALGSDTGGSIRQPAAFCGVVGLKPTYGAVSRYGLIAFASSLDQIGPMAGNVIDCALLYQILKGHDKKDSTSVSSPAYTYFAEYMDEGVEGFKIGIPRECFNQGLDKQIADSIYEAARLYEKMGAKVEEFSLPVLESGMSAYYYIISSAEASSNLGRYDGIRYGHRSESFGDMEELIVNSRTEGFGWEVKRRIMLGTYVLSSEYYDAYYKKAMQIRQKIKEVFKQLFKSYDMLLMPTYPALPFKIGEKISDPLEMYMSDIYTVIANLTGLPAISIPCGFSREGLPIGLQLLGNYFEENRLFQAAYSLERELEIFSRKPVLEGGKQNV